MGAAGAQLGRPDREREARDLQAGALAKPERAPDDVGGQLAVGRHDARRLSQDLDIRLHDPSEHPLDVRVALFEDQHAAHVAQQATHQFHRHGVDPDMEVRRVVAEFVQVLDVVVPRDACGDDPQVAALVVEAKVIEPAQLRPVEELWLPIEQLPPLASRVGRQQDPGRRNRSLGDGILRARVAGANHRAAVRETRHEADEHRDLEAFGHVERVPRHVVGFLLVRRLEADDPREVGVVARVLLVLGAVHARVVGDDDDQPAVDRDDRRVHERIGGDVEADVLHRRHRPAPGKRHAKR